MIDRRNLKSIFVTCIFIGASIFGTANAHVPFVEKEDFNAFNPFVVKDVLNSKAVFSYLENETDVDVYSIEIDQPTRIYAKTVIPLCVDYRNFSVNFAIVGPGLPAPDVDLPVPLRKGQGAVIIKDPIQMADDREWFFEPYGGRYYFRGPDFAIDNAQPGDYQMIVWHENGVIGDYLAVIGEGEYWGTEERAQAASLSKFLGSFEDLHVECNETIAVNAMKNKEISKFDREILAAN